MKNSWFVRHVRAAKEFLSGKPYRVRSNRWHEVEKQHLKHNPRCAYCGSTTGLQVHHVKPFHLYPELELEPYNLITLCMVPGLRCHLTRGHLGNWKKWNKQIKLECLIHRRASQ